MKGIVTNFPVKKQQYIKSITLKKKICNMLKEGSVQKFTYSTKKTNLFGGGLQINFYVVGDQKILMKRL